MNAELQQRILGKIQVSATTGCWNWTAGKYHNGLPYGRLNVSGSTIPAHRASYTAFIGGIPRDLTLDHLCRNPSCVNPFHLEPVSLRENVLRGRGAGANNARKTHCSRGHEFSPENTFTSKAFGFRSCRKCRRIIAREYYSKNIEAQRSYNKKYSSKNREAVNAKARRHRELHKDKIRKKAREKYRLQSLVMRLSQLRQQMQSANNIQHT